MAAHRPADWHVLDLDKDPTPGDPDRVRQLAKNLHDFAADVSDALRLVKGMAGEDTMLSWVGKSAKVFQDEFGSVPKDLKKLKTSYEMAGDALTAYWPKLERSQALADRALADGRTAQADLTTASSKLNTANDWVTRATNKSKDYDKAKDKKDVPPPDESQVRAATRDAQHANSAKTAAQSDVTSANSALDAAKKMAEDARKMREDAAREAKSKIDEASDAGIQNRHWWEEVGDWVSDNWDTIVAVCKVVVTVLGIVAMIIGGPILGAIVLIAAVIVLADTLNKYAKGQASLWDVAFAAVDCIPGGKGLTSVGKLAKGMKTLGKTGLKGMGKAAKGGMGQLRRQAQKMAERKCKSDPVDVVTGDMVASATDLELPGALSLVIERHHVSSFRGGRVFGPSWASTLDQRLLLDADGVRLITEDGMVLHYPVPEPGLSLMPVAGPRWPLEWPGTPDGSVLVHRPDEGHTFRFEALPGRPRAELPLAMITDRNGHTIRFEYDAEGSPREVVHSGGYRIAFDTSDHRITALRLLSDTAEPVVMRYGYDERGDLTEIINSSGLPLRLAYDDQHRIVAWKDRNGTRYRYTYDAEGRCVRTAGSDGFHNGTFRYDVDAGTAPQGVTMHGVTTHVDSLGHATRYEYDSTLRIQRETDALGHVTAFEWDPYDRLLARTDELGRTTRYAYDAEGNTTLVTRPDGLGTEVRYNSLRLPISIVEPGGSAWVFGYDERGNLLTATDPTGATTRHTYDRSGRLTAVTDAMSHTRTYESDTLGRPTATVDALGATTRYTYDLFGRVESLTDPTGGVTRFGWTTEGLPAWRTTPGGATERWVHDGEGNEIEHVDAMGAVTRFEYTHFDLLLACTHPDGSRQQFRHDTELRVTSVTDPLGREWSYTYDAVGNLIGERDFNGGALRYTYDAARRLTSRSDTSGNVTTFVRDLLDNLTEQRTRSGVTSFSYDALGRPVRAENNEATVLIQRDPVGRITAETCNGRTLHSTYDPLGRRTRRITPTGFTSTWEYDANHRPTVLSTAGERLHLSYDTAGRETERRTGTSVLRQEWDTDHRLTAQTLHSSNSSNSPHSTNSTNRPNRPSGTTAQLQFERQYTYRADDYATGVEDSVSGPRRFELDAAARISAVHARSWTERYAYDPGGNITHATWPASRAPHDPGAAHGGAGAGTSALDGDATGPRAYGAVHVRRAGGISYAYDDHGRLVRSTRKLLSGGSRTWHYRWNDEDQLREVTVPDGRCWRYLYDPFGRRIAKQLLDGEEVLEQTDFTWDDASPAERTRTGDGRTTTWDWSPENDLPLAQTEHTHTPSDHPGRAADASQREIDSRFYAIVTDLVGSPSELVTPDGRVAWRLRTTLWGLPLAADGPGYGGEADCPLRFPGQYHDEETGLHYNVHRYYDPALGRFTSMDPIGLGGGPNPAWYVPNPTAWIDPLGLALCRKDPRLETGDLKKGWLHIEARHITGTHPSPKHADMLPPSTTRDHVLDAATKIVRKGTRISDPGKTVQTFEKRMKVNGMRGRFSVSVDSTDGNNIITFFPVGKSA